jgi:hypothetical protein
VEHAEREEERVDALLVEGEPRLLVQATQRLVERLGRERGLEPLVGVPLAEGGRVVGGEVEGEELGHVVVHARRRRHRRRLSRVIDRSRRARRRDRNSGVGAGTSSSDNRGS